MGGGVTLNALVAQPGLVDAAVIYASVSSMAADNWKQFYRPSEDRSRTNRRIARTYGLPDDSPEFWRAASPRPYFDRVTEPLLVHHGIKTTPVRSAGQNGRSRLSRRRTRTSPSSATAGRATHSSASGSARSSGRCPSSTSISISRASPASGSAWRSTPPARRRDRIRRRFHSRRRGGSGAGRSR